MHLPLRRSGLNRQTPFSFSCRQCLKCCRAKKIQVNPYEIARLAANLGLSTTEFIERYTGAGGTCLSWKADNSCIFLGDTGCMVHRDRPLVCRLYPLGRKLDESGRESFGEIEPDPDCRGDYGEHQLIGDYLENQDIDRYVDAADRYLKVLWRMVEIVQLNAAIPERADAVAEGLRGIGAGRDQHAVSWLDMDPLLAVYCAEHELELPTDINLKMLFHLQALQMLIEA